MVYSVSGRAMDTGYARRRITVEDTAIDLGSWQITADAAREYLDAVGDDLPVYGDTDIAPPLMLTARVVGLLLDRLSLPDGAIHSLQDVETVGAPRIGMTAATIARVDPPRERGGLRFLTVNYSVTDTDSGGELQRGRTTVLLPPPADEPAGEDSDG